MTTANSHRLSDALRACARGIHPLEAGAGLLIDCGSWLHRDDFTSRFITTGTNISDGTTVLVYDVLPGIDRRNASLVVSAIAHAAGHADLKTDKQYLNG